ncbi:MAG: dihydroorotate dehydrogenase-like protein [Candidatus Thermofonsia bacterium]|nr:MAG: dihydroorotate dehydrogenase-like protein [Candidatus Thermofonsia bacterium]
MDMKTTYLGMELKSPIVPSASPLSRDLGTLRQMEDAGAGAVVLYSLFEEEINMESQTLDRYLTEGVESYSEALSYFPEALSYEAVGPDKYLSHIRQAKKALSIPVIASLNGVSTGGWIRYAKEIEEAGADALELNVYYIPTSLDMTSELVEKLYLDVLRDVKESVSIPVQMKLNPYFSALGHMARRLENAGADGLALFNRFYQPDLDLENLEVVPNLKLSRSDDLRLPLRWIAILYGRIHTDFALTSGVHTSVDALKGIAAGATVVNMASELLRNGVGRISEILAEMEAWLEEKEYESLDQLRGSLSQQNVTSPAAFERANYVRVIRSFEFV